MLRGALLVHQVLPHGTVSGGQREESPTEKNKTELHHGSETETIANSVKRELIR